jgi:hypothetical protein
MLTMTPWKPNRQGRLMTHAALQQKLNQLLNHEIGLDQALKINAKPHIDY